MIEKGLVFLFHSSEGRARGGYVINLEDIHSNNISEDENWPQNWPV